MNASFRSYSASLVVSQPKIYFPALKGPILYAFLLFFHFFIVLIFILSPLTFHNLSISPENGIFDPLFTASC